MGVFEWSETEIQQRQDEMAVRQTMDRTRARALDLSVASPEPTAKQVLAVVARAHAVTVAELVGRRRTNALTRARQEAWAILRAQGRSYPEIGRITSRHHTTVIDGVRRYRERAGDEAPPWTHHPKLSAVARPAARSCARCSAPLPLPAHGQTYEVWWFVRPAGGAPEETCQPCAEGEGGTHGIRAVRR